MLQNFSRVESNLELWPLFHQYKHISLPDKTIPLLLCLHSVMSVLLTHLQNIFGERRVGESPIMPQSSIEQDRAQIFQALKQEAIISPCYSIESRGFLLLLGP